MSQTQKVMDLVSEKWDREIVNPQLTTYIKIPDKSPMFDPQWVEHVATWLRR